MYMPDKRAARRLPRMPRSPRVVQRPAAPSSGVAPAVVAVGVRDRGGVIKLLQRRVTQRLRLPPVLFFEIFNFFARGGGRLPRCGTLTSMALVLQAQILRRARAVSD